MRDPVTAPRLLWPSPALPLGGIYIGKGNMKDKTKINSNEGKVYFLPFLGGVPDLEGAGEGDKESFISSSKERLTANLSSYLVARFLGGMVFFAFAMI